MFFLKIITFLVALLLASCTPTHPLSFDNSLILSSYKGSYYIGFGTGESSSKENAIKVAKMRALGELADNIKVTIVSKLELFSSEWNSNGQYSYNETIKEKIISIGEATIRFPDYEILEIIEKRSNYSARVLAKISKDQFLNNSFNEFSIEDDMKELIKNMLTEKSDL